MLIYRSTYLGSGAEASVAGAETADRTDAITAAQATQAPLRESRHPLREQECGMPLHVAS